MKKVWFILLSMITLRGAQEYGIGISVNDYTSFSEEDSQQVLRHLADCVMVDFSSNFKKAQDKLVIEEQKNHSEHTVMVLLDSEIIKLAKKQETFEITAKKPTRSFDEWANEHLLEKIISDGMRDNFHQKKNVYLKAISYLLSLYHNARPCDTLLRKSEGATRADNFTHVLCHLLPRFLHDNNKALTRKYLQLLTILKQKEAAQRNGLILLEQAKKARLETKGLVFDCELS